MRAPLHAIAAVGLSLLCAWAAACGGKIKDDSQTISSSSGTPSPTVTSTVPVPTTTTTSTGKVPPPPPTTTNVVACGSKSCDVTFGLCCSTNGGESCVGGAGDCKGTTQACDDTSDCPGDTPICCMRPLGNGLRMSATCTESCILNSISFQACATSAECEGGQKCRPHRCQGRDYNFCGEALEGFCEQ